MRVLKLEHANEITWYIHSFRVYDPFEGIETFIPFVMYGLELAASGFTTRLRVLKPDAGYPACAIPPRATGFRVYDPFEGIETAPQQLVTARHRRFRVYDPFEGIETEVATHCLPME